MSADNTACFEDAFNLLCGDLIGRGCSRHVYECTLMPEYVVKVENGAHSFENIAEWLTWKAASKNATRWLAMCHSISPDGRILIMERTRPPSKDELPKRVPVWCSDLKLSNWGFAIDQKGSSKKWAVCHDYGALSSKILTRGVDSSGLVKANWIEG